MHRDKIICFLFLFLIIACFFSILYNKKESFTLFQEGDVSLLPENKQEKLEQEKELEKTQKQKKEQEQEQTEEEKKQELEKTKEMEFQKKIQEEQENRVKMDNEIYEKNRKDQIDNANNILNQNTKETNVLTSEKCNDTNYILKSSIVPFVQPVFGYLKEKTEKKTVNNNPLLPKYNTNNNDNNDDDERTIIQQIRSFLQKHDEKTNQMDKNNNSFYVKNYSGKPPTMTKYEKAYEIMDKKQYEEQKKQILDNNLKKCPACAPCGQCPDPAFECKMVPNYKLNSVVQPYSTSNSSSLSVPRPMLNSFSTFAM
jgi:hypothetical protein